MDMSDMFQVFRKEVEWAGRKLVLETGKIARQADGAVLATYGGTTVLAAVVFEKKPKPGLDFFPLTVNYQEKAFAAGKIPGGFFKREGRPSEKEVLTSRLIDRPIRPLFHESYRNETLVVATTLAHDLENDPDIVAMIATSAALTISGVPFMGPIARRPRRLPRRQVRRQSDLRPDRAEHARHRRRRHQGRRADGRVRGQGAARGRHAERRDGGSSVLPAGDRRHHPARRALRQGSAAAHRSVGSVQDRGRQAQVRDAGQAGRGLCRDRRSSPARPRSARSRPRPRSCSKATTRRSPPSASSSATSRPTSCATPSSIPASASTVATPRPSGRSWPRSACCRAPTARRCSPAARRRRWSWPRSAPARTSRSSMRSRASTASTSCCTTTSLPTRWAKCAAWVRPAGARSATASSPGVRCARCCPARRSSRTRSASCRRSPRATARPRWPRCAAARWR